MAIERNGRKTVRLTCIMFALLDGKLCGIFFSHFSYLIRRHKVCLWVLSLSHVWPSSVEMKIPTLLHATKYDSIRLECTLHTI